MKTKYKIFLAKIIYIFLKNFIKKKNLIIFRNGLKWSIDISEAIDLHLFLFGNFEKEISSTAKLLDLSQNKHILDIGANFGVQTLQFANQFPDSVIHAIEPTNFAYEKMLKNIDYIVVTVRLSLIYRADIISSYKINVVQMWYCYQA